MYMGRSYATIVGNPFLGNLADAGDGGAIHAASAGAALDFLTIRHNYFGANVADDDGGALWLVDEADVTIVENNVFVDNGAWGRGGGIYAFGIHKNQFARIANNTMASNWAALGGHVYFWEWPYDVSANQIVWGRAGGGVYVDHDQIDDRFVPMFSFNNVYGNSGQNWGGFLESPEGDEGNISADPGFVAFLDDENPTNDNFHLRSTAAGRDTGLPNPGYNDPDGSRNDIGAYGGPRGGWVPWAL